MTPEQYAIVRVLYDAVIDLPPDERARSLATAAFQYPNPDELIAAVMRLVHAAEVGTFARISTPVQSMIGSLNLPTVTVGDVFGAWRVLRPLGEGGMGSVWLVERSDASFTQTAALKFVKGMLREETLNYFTRERQLLAKLNHPNIARLIDGGATKDSFPYLVMEYVDGKPIDQVCREKHLDEKSLLQLFVGICDAIAFAHRQLVVHCDLKPSNILVNAEGRPILLDFGIARLLEVGENEVKLLVEVGGTSAAPTSSVSKPEPASPSRSGSSSGSTSSTPFTPRYASPEQKTAGIVSTASDIYSLGVMFRELLTATHGGALPHDLDAVLKKAAAHDPDQRYSTVEALQADLMRYQSQEPVMAIPATPAYLARKFLRRRWPLVLAGAAFIVTVAGFTLKVVLESERAIRAEGAALQERDRAQAAEILALKERDAKETARRDALQERDRAQSAESQAVKDREAKEAARRDALRDRDRARAAEQVAVEERTRASEAEASATASSKFLISAFNYTSTAPDAESGDPPTSKLLAAAEQRLAKDLTEQPATQATLYYTLAKVQGYRGNAVKARENYRRAIELERKNKRPLLLAEMLTQLASIDANQFGGKEALSLAREAVALCEKHASADSAELAQALMTLGSVINTVGDEKAATPILLRALAIVEKHDPTNQAAADTLGVLAKNMLGLRRYEEAAGYFRRVLAIHEKRYGADHPFMFSQLQGLAAALQGQRQYTEAEATFRRLLAAQEKTYGKYNNNNTTLYLRMASLMAETGRLRESLEFDRGALEIVEKVIGRESSGYVVSLNQVASRLEALGREEEALVTMRESVRHSLKVYPAVHASRMRLERNLGRMLSDAGQTKDAIEHLRTAYDMSKRLFGPIDGKHREVALVLAQVAIADARAGKLDDARARLDELERQLPQSGSDLKASVAKARAVVAAKSGQWDAAIPHYLELERLMTELLSVNDPGYWLAKSGRAEALAARNQGEDRAQSRALAAEILAKVEPLLDPSSPSISKLRQMQAR